MATKSKEQLASAKSDSAKKLAEKSVEKSAAKTQTSVQKTSKREAAKATTASKKETRKAKAVEGGTQEETSITASSGPESNHKGITFLAADCITEDIWVPNTTIPSLDQATYESRKTKAEGQRRAIEVANLNLQNIHDLNQLEGQSIEAAISAKTNETRTAQLTSADIEYQTQLEINGEKSQHQKQAAARREAATRQTGYTEQLIALKDQNFELEIQQAQTVFAEKAARYRAQLTGQ